MSLDEPTLLATLHPYPTAYACFAPYVNYLCTQGNAQKEEYDLLRILITQDKSRLQLIEQRLHDSRTILAMELSSFARAFGFLTDLLTEDPEKVYDILAEPLLAVDLYNHAFTDICKLPSSIKVGHTHLAAADFLASRGPHRYAIELKTVRMESHLEPDKFIGDPNIPYWWGTMLRNNASTKIEDKERRVLRQLANTANHWSCDVKMLVIYTRRLGVSTLLNEAEWLHELEQLANRYPEVDVICGKSLFDDIYFFPPLT